MMHLPRLDALRGIAIILVLIQHFGWYYFAHLALGRYGVDLFFVLSGFLITRILINEKASVKEGLRKFFGRRSLRIWPIYFATIFILLLLGNQLVKENLLALISYTFNYFGTGGVNEISHLWSLSVEEQFYIFYPFIVLPLRKKLRTLSGAIVIIVLLSFIQITTGSIINEIFNYTGTFPRTYMLGVGCLSAIHWSTWKGLGNVANDILVIVVIVFLLLINNIVSEVGLPLLWAYFIVRITAKERLLGGFDHLLQNSFLQKIGIISYGIYIFHKPLDKYIVQPLVNYLYNNLNWESIGKPLSYLFYNPFILPIIINCIVTYFFAFLSYNYFEKPILSLKEKYFK